MNELYLEDFVSGQVFASGRLRIDREQVKAFAAQFDPQPYHLDAEAAAKSVFRGLAASSWHITSITMLSWSRESSGWPTASWALASTN
jgi:acyl dehydratase